MRKRKLRRLVRQQVEYNAMLLQRIEALERKVYGSVVPESFVDTILATAQGRNIYRDIVTRHEDADGFVVEPLVNRGTLDATR